MVGDVIEDRVEVGIVVVRLSAFFLAFSLDRLMIDRMIDGIATVIQRTKRQRLTGKNERTVYSPDQS